MRNIIKTRRLRNIDRGTGAYLPAAAGDNRRRRNPVAKYILAESRRLSGLLLLPLLLFAAGCAHDTAGFPAAGEGTARLSFVMHIPGAQIPEVSARSMADDDDTVREIDILLFDATQAIPVFLERISLGASDFVQSGSTVDFTLYPQTRNHRVLVMAVANASAVLDGLTWIGPGSNKRDVVGAMIRKAAGSTPQDWAWNTSDGTFTPIPMYGETEVPSITPAMAPVTGITLTRMLARIDVRNSADDFVLNRVHLVNYYISGFVAPPFDDDGVIHPDWEPYTIAADKREGSSHAIGYDYDVTGWMQGEIYAYEALRADDRDEQGRRSAACLIFEGEYRGQVCFYRVDFTEFKESPDIYDVSYIPLKRNYKYMVDITAVDGAGYVDMDEAINSYTTISNMKTRILSYDMSIVTSVVFDGQYMLGVKSETMQYNTSGNPYHDFQEHVYTTHPEGWVATIVEGGDWLEFVSYPPPDYNEVFSQTSSGEGYVHGALRFHTKTAFERVARSAKIRITTAGERLVIYATVSQSSSAPPELSMVILDENGVELPLTGYADNFPVYRVSFGLGIEESEVAPQRIYLKTTGVDKVVFAGYPQTWLGGAPVTYKTPNLNPIPFPNGLVWNEGALSGWDYDTAYSFTESIQGYDIELEARSVGEENGEFRSRNYFILLVNDPWSDTQRVFLDVYQGDWIQFAAEEYMLGNVDYTVGVKSKAPWRIKEIRENRTAGPNFSDTQRNLLAAEWKTVVLGTTPYPYLKSGATGGVGATALNQVTTTLSLLTERWQKNRAGEVVVVFEATEGDYPDKSVRFKVSDRHLDYTAGGTVAADPYFYVFPYYMDTDKYIYDSADPTYSGVCGEIGTGWRLPTMAEAMMISSYRQSVLGSDTGYLANYPGASQYHKYGFGYNSYWSSSVMNGTSFFSMQYIENGYGTPAVYNQAQTYGIRCVYKPAPENTVYPRIETGDPGGPVIISRDVSDAGVNSYSILPSGGGAAGTFEDLGTHRVAARLQIADQDETIPADLDSYMTWEEARNACADRGGGWRLPTYREMLLIVACGGNGPAISAEDYTNGNSLADISSAAGYTPLSSHYMDVYWTGTTHEADARYAWTVNLNGPYFNVVLKTNKGEYLEDPGDPESRRYVGAIRCVRSAE